MGMRDTVFGLLFISVEPIMIEKGPYNGGVADLEIL